MERKATRSDLTAAAYESLTKGGRASVDRALPISIAAPPAAHHRPPESQLGYDVFDYGADESRKQYRPFLHREQGQQQICDWAASPSQDPKCPYVALPEVLGGRHMEKQGKAAIWSDSLKTSQYAYRSSSNTPIRPRIASLIFVAVCVGLSLLLLCTLLRSGHDVRGSERLSRRIIPPSALMSPFEAGKLGGDTMQPQNQASPVQQRAVDLYGAASEETSFAMRDLGLCFLLGIYVLASFALEKLPVTCCHESVVSVLLGLTLGLCFDSSTNSFQFDFALFNYVLLPPIIFGAGFTLKRRMFCRFLHVIVLLGIGVTILMFLQMSYFLRLWHDLRPFKTYDGHSIPLHGFEPFLVLSAVLCCSDTVAAMSAIRPRRRPKAHAVVFGEGITNDVVSIILSQSLIGVAQLRLRQGVQVAGDVPPTITLRLLLVDTAYYFATSGAVGVVFGLTIAYGFRVHRATLNQDPVRAVALVFIGAYLSYLVSGLLGFSAILSIFICGVITGHYVWHSLIPTGRVLSMKSAALVGFMAEAFTFGYFGITASSVVRTSSAFSPSLIIAASILIPVCRAFAFPLYLLLDRLINDVSNRLDLTDNLLVYGGGLLRGSFSYALIIHYAQQAYASAPKTPEYLSLRSILVGSVLGVILGNVLILGFLLPLFAELLTGKAPPSTHRIVVLQDTRSLVSLALESVRDRGFSVFRTPYWSGDYAKKRGASEGKSENALLDGGIPSAAAPSQDMYTSSTGQLISSLPLISISPEPAEPLAPSERPARGAGGCNNAAAVAAAASVQCAPMECGTCRGYMPSDEGLLRPHPWTPAVRLAAAAANDSLAMSQGGGLGGGSSDKLAGVEDPVRCFSWTAEDAELVGEAVLRSCCYAGSRSLLHPSTSNNILYNADLSSQRARIRAVSGASSYCTATDQGGAAASSPQRSPQREPPSPPRGRFRSDEAALQKEANGWLMQVPPEIDSQASPIGDVIAQVAVQEYKSPWMSQWWHKFEDSCMKPIFGDPNARALSGNLSDPRCFPAPLLREAFGVGTQQESAEDESADATGLNRGITDWSCRNEQTRDLLIESYCATLRQLFAPTSGGGGSAIVRYPNIQAQMSGADNNDTDINSNNDAR